MAFPDRIERTVEIAHPPSTVWAALTTAEGLGRWFGNDATIDLRPGGAARLEWEEGHTADLRVERVEELTEPVAARHDAQSVVRGPSTS